MMMVSGDRVLKAQFNSSVDAPPCDNYPNIVHRRYIFHKKAVPLPPWKQIVNCNDTPCWPVSSFLKAFWTGST